MLDLESLYLALKIISIVGLIVTSTMIVAIIYKKLKDYYPEDVEKRKHIFLIIAIVLSGVLVFMFDKFFLSR